MYISGKFPGIFADTKKMNPDESTLSPFIDLLVCHNRITEGIEYIIPSNQVDDRVLLQLLHNLIPDITQHEHDATFFQFLMKLSD